MRRHQFPDDNEAIEAVRDCLGHEQLNNEFVFQVALRTLSARNKVHLKEG